jgi:hypothetical protein
LTIKNGILSFEGRSKGPGIVGVFKFKQRAENAGIEWFIFGYFVNEIHDGNRAIHSYEKRPPLLVLNKSGNTYIFR